MNLTKQTSSGQIEKFFAIRPSQINGTSNILLGVYVELSTRIRLI